MPASGLVPRTGAQGEGVGRRTAGRGGWGRLPAHLVNAGALCGSMDSGTNSLPGEARPSENPSVSGAPSPFELRPFMLMLLPCAGEREGARQWARGAWQH